MGTAFTTTKRVAVLLAAWISIHVVAAPVRAEGPEETLQFERLPIEERSGGGIIFSILQDRRGFIWLGTDGGLKRHDGYEFLTFESNPSDPLSLASDEIRALLEDRGGVLWVGTEAGLYRFDRTTRHFERVPDGSGTTSGLSDPRIRSLCEDGDGNLWVGTDNGLNRLDTRTGAITQFLTDSDNPDSLGRSVIQTITEDRDGLLWLGTRNGLDRLDPTTPSWTRYLHDPDDPSSLPWPVVTSVFEDSSGVLWVGTHGGGLSKLDRDRGTFTTFAETSDTNHPGNSVMSIVEDGAGLWIATYGGLKWFDRASGRTVTHEARPTDPSGLTSGWVETLFIDRGGNLWIGTHNGTNKLLAWRKRFKNYVHDPSVPGSLPRGRVTAISEDDAGNLWVATWGGGIAKHDRKSGSFTHFRHDPDDSNSLGRDWVVALYHERSGDLWAGTNSFGGLSRFDPRTETFTHYRHDPSDATTLSSNRILSIRQDKRGTLWFGTSGAGLNRLDRSDKRAGRFRRYLHAPGEHGARHNTVQSIYEDRGGALWIGTAGGLDRFDRSAERFVAYDDDPQRDLTVHVMHEDETGVLWLGTSRGLWSVDPAHERLRQTQALEEIPVFGLLEDDDGDLWLHTTRGLTEYGPREESIRHFSHGDGFRPAGRDVYVSNAHFRGADKTMFFGGVNGLTEFDPEQIRENPHLPELVLTDFKLFHESVPFGTGAVLAKPIGETSAIELSHRDHTVSFEFAALNFASPENNQYAYRLDGFDQDWVHAGSARSATYTNLIPGEYTFRVKGSNNDGRWNEDGVAIDVHIAPALWQTTWFVVIASMFLIGVGLSGHRLRVYRLERTRKLLRVRVREGTAELFDKNRHLEAEIQQREQAERALQHRIGIEMLIAALSNNFINLAPEDADRGIGHALHMIGVFGAVGRSYVFLFSEDGERFSNTHEWCGDGVRSMLERCQELPSAQFPWFIGKMRSLEIIQVHAPDALPHEAGTLRELLETEGIQSLINVPMAAAGELVGFLGFDTLETAKVWSKEDVRLLSMVGEMFVGALERKQADAELRTAQTQLVHSEKAAAQGRLTAGILHELNTPVGVLKANADLAVRCVARLKTAPEEHQERALRVLEDSSAANACASLRIEHILNRLKKFVRLDASPFAFADIHENLDSTLALLSARLRPDITVRKDYGKVPRIGCYPAELNQVFLTLLDNAIDAIECDGSITLHTSTMGSDLVIRIIDSGRGMPEDTLERLFDMNLTTHGSRVGVGMGLVQAYDVVQRHHGSITATSRPGSGTEVEIRLPTEPRNGIQPTETVSA